MHTDLSYLSLWPHFVLVCTLAILGLRVHSQWKLLFAGCFFAIAAVWLYFVLMNGVAPPHGSEGGQMLALAIASLVPMIGTAEVSYRLHQRGIASGWQAVGATVVGTLLTIVVPSLQVMLGCSFTGICP